MGSCTNAHRMKSSCEHLFWGLQPRSLKKKPHNISNRTAMNLLNTRLEHHFHEKPACLYAPQIVTTSWQEPQTGSSKLKHRRRKYPMEIWEKYDVPYARRKSYVYISLYACKCHTQVKRKIGGRGVGGRNVGRRKKTVKLFFFLNKAFSALYVITI